jgi:MoxR-like ATPase
MSNKSKIIELKNFMESKIIGQEDLVKKLIISLLADGHVLVEGAPGLAKTKAIKTLSDCINSDYNRIQFTPDLLPSDVTGSDIYLHNAGKFEFVRGPIFSNLILSDEINRAPAKVQSALLEAMAERQVTIGGKKYNLPNLFMVMATQNPIEQEGTYNLPEAQLDRFLMYVKIDQPNSDSEKRILQLVRGEVTDGIDLSMPKLEIEDILSARKEIFDVYMSDEMEEYLVQLIIATRNPEKYDVSLSNLVVYGASPRATIALDRCARINAWLMGRDFVSPDDIWAVVYDILRHRIILSFEAQAEGYSSDDIIKKIVELVPLP